MSFWHYDGGFFHNGANITHQDEIGCVTLKKNITTSSGGENWSTPKIVETYEWTSITYGNGKYVMVGGYGYIITSVDGENWSNSIRVGLNRWHSITYSHGEFIVVGDDGYCSTSIDGVNWTTPEQIKDESGKVVTADLNGICAMP